jgi:hypothetical protein
MKKLAIIIGLFSAPVFAHHSAIQFDFTKQVSYTGTVKEFKAINPHMQMIVEVADAKGKHEVHFEGHSTNNMYRTGYRKGMVNVGDKITVNCAPQRDGVEGGYVVSISTPNGDFGMKSSRLAQQAAEGK